MDELVHHLRNVHVGTGRYIIHKGDAIKRLIIIEHGEVELIEDNVVVATLKEGSMIGETALLQHSAARYDVVAKTNVRIFEITSNDFNNLHQTCPELIEIVEKESKQELMHLLSNNNGVEQHNNAKKWANKAATHLHRTSYVPTQVEINREAQKHNSAPLSIWLGIFLDGIPESFVIGAGFILILAAKVPLGAVSMIDVIPYTLIAGLFLSNFPEAMSSSIGMKKMGWKPLKILTLWTSLMLMTALGAVFGYYYGVKIPNYLEIGVEGLAAGSMLTMIAQTMIPEAVHIGGNRVTGLSTLAGYLSAVAFKIFE
jgi:zinc transporter ZupT